MNRIVCQRLLWITLFAACGLANWTATAAIAQDPVIVPGLPGMGLQTGERPARTDRSLSQLPGAEPEAPLEENDERPPEIVPFGVSGDWFGSRQTLLDKGLDFRANVSQFYQGVTTGGLQEGFAYGVKLDYFETINAEKLFGWDGAYLHLHGESRFGECVNPAVGSLVPANFALQFPQPAGSATALTNMQFEQFLNPNFAVTFGKLNAADGVNIHPFLGGNGVDRFLNEAFVLNPVYGRTIPYSALGAGFSFLRDNDPIFTFLVLDTNGQPGASGFTNLFGNGATLFAHLRVPVTPFGLPGHQSLEGAYASGTFSPLSKDDYVILDAPAIPATQQTGSWVLTYAFDQFLIVDQENPNKGWGIFGSVSFADAATNPIRSFSILGVGGASPLPGRDADSYGAAGYFLGSSGVLRQVLESVAPIGNEQGFEFFYNARIAPWFTLAADVQVIDPAQLHAPMAVLFSLRAKTAL